MALTTQLRSQLAGLNADLKNTQSKQADLLADKNYDQAATLGDRAAQINSQISTTNTQLSDAYNSPGSTVKPSNNSLVGTDNSDLSSISKYQKSEIVGDVGANRVATNNQPAPRPARRNTGSSGRSAARLGTLAAVAGLAFGAQKLLKSFKPGIFNMKGPNIGGGYSGKKERDLRVKIAVPSLYLRSVQPLPISELQSYGAIIFPYTPSIQFEQSAQYQSQTPIHSNYPLNFYQRSTVGNITIQGKFTVENNKDAALYLGTIQLLRVLTKMRWGDDVDAGAPPPVCELKAYGTFMLDSIPVAIQSFRIELPDTVDYFTYSDEYKYSSRATAVPTLSSITVTCIPMFSRDEIKNFSVDKLLSDYDGERDKGYL